MSSSTLTCTDAVSAPAPSAPAAALTPVVTCCTLVLLLACTSAAPVFQVPPLACATVSRLFVSTLTAAPKAPPPRPPPPITTASALFVSLLSLSALTLTAVSFPLAVICTLSKSACVTPSAESTATLPCAATPAISPPIATPPPKARFSVDDLSLASTFIFLMFVRFNVVSLSCACTCLPSCVLATAPPTVTATSLLPATSMLPDAVLMLLLSAALTSMLPSLSILPPPSTTALVSFLP